MFFFNTVQPGNSIVLRQGCDFPVDCVKQNIEIFQKNLNINHYNHDPTWDRKHGAGNSNLSRKSRSKEEEVYITTESKGIFLVKFTQGHPHPNKQDFRH